MHRLSFILVVVLLSSCTKALLNRLCIEVDKTTVKVGEQIKVSNCENRTPPNVDIDWGDGSEKSSGLDNTHTYSKEGTFTIKVLYKDEEVDRDELRKVITVTK